MNRTIIFTILCLLITTSINAQTRIPVKQGENGLQLTYMSKDGFSIQNSISHFDVLSEDMRSAGGYVELKLDGYGLSFNIGNPDLPVLNRLIEVPLEAQVEIIVTSYNEVIYNLSYFDISKQIMPSQESVSKSADISTLTFAKNETVYATNDWFSNPVALYHDEGIMRGVRIGRLEINPFAYNPVTGELKIFDNLEIEVKFLNSDHKKTKMLKNKYYSPAYNGLFVGLLNYSSSSREDLIVNSIPMRFEIISHRMFEATLAPFVEWKRKQGFIVNVRYTDEPAIGTTTTSIKNYLQGLYVNATETNPAPAYIALIGDVAQVPAFVGNAPPNYPHPTDLYYTTYDGANDILPDVFIGRLSAQNVAQLTAILDKTLMYEKFEMPDPSYLARTLAIAGYDTGYSPLYCNGTLNYMQHYLNTEHGINPHWMYHPCSGQTSQVVSKLNEGVGLALYTAHCNVTLWGDPELTISNVNNLTNTNKYGLYIGNCCLSAKFDQECIAEAVIRAPNKGGVGYIGGSESTYWSEDYWWAVGYGTVVLNPQIANFGTGFFDSWFQENNEPVGLRGITGSQMMVAGNLAVNQSSSSYKKYYWEIYHFLGDPTLMPFVGQMPEMTPDYMEVLPLGMNTLTINNLAPKSYVALTDNGVLKAAGFADNSGTIVLDFEQFNEPCTASLVATTTFYRPFIGTVEVISADSPYIILQSYNIEGDSDFGKTVGINFVLKNVSNNPFNAYNVKINVETESQYVILPDEPVILGNINAGTVYTSENELFVTIAENVPNNELIVLKLKIACEYEDETYEFETTVKFQAYAPTLDISEIYIENSNGIRINRFNANANNNLVVVFKNTGHADLHNVNVAVSVISAFMNVPNNSSIIETIGKDNTALVKFLINAGNAPSGTLASMVVRASSGAFTDEMIYTNTIGTTPGYFMSNGTLTTEFANFYDSGGPNNSYYPNENLKLVFKPANTDKKLKIRFLTFNVEENNDNLYIYNGIEASSESLLATLTGSELPEDYESTNAEGALTFEFKSNLSVQPDGWTAVIYEMEQYYNVSFTIIDEENKPVTDATIIFDGYVLAKNQFNVSLVAPGEYTYSVIKEGYSTKTAKTEVKNEDIQLDITLGNEPETYSITFYVHNGEPVEGAKVEVEDETKMTNSSGIAVFELINGDYNYTVTKDNYSTESGKITVENEDDEIPVQLTQVSISINNVSDIYVYPNPFNDIINIGGNSSLVKKVSISNMLGQKIKEIDLNGKTSFTTENLPKGIYIIIFKRFDGKFETLKMIKQ